MDEKGTGVINMVQPEPFIFSSPEKWPQWKKRFTRFLSCSGISKRTEPEKIDFLIYAMGAEAEDAILRFTNKPDTVDKTLEAFDKLFEPKINVIFERFKFNSRVQMANESVSNFITDLYSLVEKCDYGDLKQELIRDRIVVGMLDVKTSEAMQLIPQLTLERAIEMASQSEIQRSQNQVIRSVDTHNVNAVKSQRKGRHSNSKSSNSNQSQSPAKCLFCGGNFHHRNQCPANESKCNHCQIVGHYAKVCRKRLSNTSKTQKNSSKPAGSSNAAKSTSSNKNIHNIDVSNYEFIGCIDHINNNSYRTPSEWRINIKIVELNKHVNFLIDSGSGHICMPSKIFPKNILDDLSGSNCELFGPDGNKLKVLGKYPLTLVFQNAEFNVSVFVIDQLNQPIFGRIGIEFYKLFEMSSINEIKSTTVDVRNEFPTLFNSIGEFKGNVSIKLKPDAIPFAQTVPRIVAVPLMHKLENEINRLKSLGIIEPIDEITEWVAPIVVVPKGDEIRLCVDYTELNKSVLRPYFPITKVESTLLRMKNAKYFSKIDANRGFYQIKLDEESQKLTCFICPYGRFVFKRLPFGISCAPEYFVTKYSKILEGIENAVYHVDDVCIFGKTIEEHDKTLRLVLGRFRDEGITINDKCVFGAREILFLGQILNENGISIDPQRIEALVKFPPPENKTELLRFTGMINFIARHIPNRSQIMEPLNALLKQDVSYIWGEHQREAFNNIKKLISEAPTLAYFDHSKKIIISADASSYGLGACLMQENEQSEREVVAYISRTMTDTERYYAQIEKEALGLTWASEKFSEYVTGIQITLETDHKPLLQILKTKHLDSLTPRLLRFRMRLMKYDYDIVYTPGKLLVIPDSLSRSPLPSSSDTEELGLEVEAFVNLIIGSLPIKDNYLLKIKESQDKDESCKLIKQFISNSWPEKSKLPVILNPYFQHRFEFSIVNGLLLKGNRLVIPPDLQKQVLDFIHLGHQGIVKCRRRAQMSVWWIGLSIQLQNMIKNCPNCIEERSNPKETFVREKFPHRPMEKVAVDLFKCEKWYMIFTDYYSRYFEIFALVNMTESVIIDNLKQVFSRFGICDTLRSDNGPQFKGKFQEFAKEFNFIHETSSPYYSQSNGAVEAAVKIAKSLIKKNKDLNVALLSYRTTPLENGFTPAELMLGRKIKSHLPVLPSLLNFPDKPIQQDVAAKEDRAKEILSERYNKRHNSKELSPLNINDSVWVVDIRQYAKVIKKLKAPRSYLVKTQNGVYRRNRWHLIPAPYKDNVEFNTYNHEIPPEVDDVVIDNNEPTSSSNSNEIQMESRNADPNNSSVYESPDSSLLSSTPITVGRTRRPPIWLKDYETNFD